MPIHTPRGVNDTAVPPIAATFTDCVNFTTSNERPSLKVADLNPEVSITIRDPAAFMAPLAARQATDESEFHTLPSQALDPVRAAAESLVVPSPCPTSRLIHPRVTKAFVELNIAGGSNETDSEPVPARPPEVSAKRWLPTCAFPEGLLQVTELSAIQNVAWQADQPPMRAPPLAGAPTNPAPTRVTIIAPDAGVLGRKPIALRLGTSTESASVAEPARVPAVSTARKLPAPPDPDAARAARQESDNQNDASACDPPEATPDVYSLLLKYCPTNMWRPADSNTAEASAIAMPKA